MRCMLEAVHISKQLGSSSNGSKAAYIRPVLSSLNERAFKPIDLLRISERLPWSYGEPSVRTD